MNKNKILGNVTEMQIKTSFMMLGYNVSTPEGDCERYDFIADIGSKLIRVQCKTAILLDDNTIELDCRHGSWVNGKHINTAYDKDEIDFFATYYNYQCYLIPVEKSKIRIRLRLNPTKSGQLNNINWAEDYLLENILKSLIGENRG